MAERYYNIARHLVSVAGKEEPDLLATIPGFGPFLTSAGAADLRIVFGQNVDVPLVEPSYAFHFENDVFVCRYYVSGTRQCFTMTGGNGNRYSMAYWGGNEAVATSVDNPDALRFMIWMAMAMFGSTRNMAPIHAACVVHDGCGYIFLGESGTGKSTHARLWIKNIEGCRLLNDDSPIITLENRLPIIYGSPWSGKTHCYHTDGYPLKAIVRLHQSAENRIEKLDTLRSVAAIEPSLPPALRYNNGLTSERLDFIGRLLCGCNVFSMGCRADDEAAKVCSMAVKGDVGATSGHLKH